VYFQLWAYQSARLAGLDTAPAALDTLRRTVRAATDREAWFVRLAARATGEITRDQILASARTARQRAEAHFYEALDALARGDAADATRELSAVLDTRMIHDFEYHMAASLIERGVSVPSTRVAASATSASASVTAPARR
jgi:hypothetical protein